MSKWMGSLTMLVACAALLASGCADSVSKPGDVQETLDVQEGETLGDASDTLSTDAKTDTSVPTDTSTTSWVRPVGSAALRILVDDSANATYGNGQMKWTGSFSWSAADNTISFATSWLPTDGPYPPLYDDGPMSAGGHEPEDAVAGDHLFEAEVWYVAEADTTFEYGVLNEFDRWIWIGPNGQVDVPAASTDTIACAGLLLPAFGSVDLKLTLDVNALHENFATVTPATYGIFLKSSVNSWTPVQLIDDGENGDDVPLDGVFTYIQSRGMGPHDGLLYDGQHAQFVFVFAQEGVNPDDGLEYKVTTQCATEGVKGYTDVATPGTMAEATIQLERDSRGKVFNTTIIVGGGNPWCEVSDDCFGSLPCEDDQCVIDGETSHPAILLIDPVKGPPAGGTEVTITGTDFLDGVIVKFGDLNAATVTRNSDTEIVAVTPAHAAGKVNVLVRNLDGGTATNPNGFEFVEPPPPNLLDWGRLNDPLAVNARMGCVAGPFFAEVYESGVTSSIDNAALIKAQFGYGPSGSDPATATTWTWTDASYPGYPVVVENNMVFASTLTPAAAGSLAYTFRFSLDAGVTWRYVDSDGAGNDVAFSAAKLGSLTVAAAGTGPVICAMTPAFGTTLGGTVVTVTGSGFSTGTRAATRVFLDGTEVGGVIITDATTLSFTTPAHAMGTVDVKVENGATETDTRIDGFTFVPKLGATKPNIDGMFGDGEWDASFLVGENDLATNWGADNILADLYLAYDAEKLYVGIRGYCEAANGIVLFVDRDFGATTGVANMATLTDGTGDTEGTNNIDDTISNGLNVTVAGFGAEIAFGARGYVETPAQTHKGWRGLADIGNFSWLLDDVSMAVSEDMIETAIPLSHIWTTGLPSQGATLAVFARIVNSDGSATSNQALPEGYDADHAWNVANIAVIPVR